MKGKCEMGAGGIRRRLRALCFCAALLGACRGHMAPVVVASQCTCSYLTDNDQPGHVEVEVCAPSAAEEQTAAAAVASRCAMNTGVGAVTDCACHDREPSAACNPAAPCVASGAK